MLEAENEGDAGADCRRRSIVGSGGSRKPARFTDGAARPARLGQGSGADRSGDRARVLASLCWLRWFASRKRNLNRRSTVSLRQVCCFGRACRRTRLICSSTHLVQDAAYGTLLREPRRALHARIAEVLESQFAEIAENQPELLARHCTEAGLIEKAAGLWGKAGQRSLERSALVEAADTVHAGS